MSTPRSFLALKSSDGVNPSRGRQSGLADPAVNPGNANSRTRNLVLPVDVNEDRRERFGGRRIADGPRIDGAQADPLRETDHQRPRLRIVRTDKHVAVGIGAELIEFVRGNVLKGRDQTHTAAKRGLSSRRS